MMKKCPVCGTDGSVNWVRGFLVAIFLGLFIGWVCGQLFHSWEYGNIANRRIERLEDRNRELRDNYVPPRK